MQEDDGTKLSKTEALWRVVRCSKHPGYRTHLVERKPILANHRGELAREVGNHGYVGKAGQLAAFRGGSILRLRRDCRPLTEWLIHHNKDIETAQISLTTALYDHG